MVALLIYRLFRLGCRKHFVTLLCCSLLTTAWASGARTATNDTIRLNLSIEKQVPATAISAITHADDTGAGPVLTNQVCELGEEPAVGVVIAGPRIYPYPTACVMMTTNAKKLRLSMKLTGPSGKVVTRTVVEDKPGTNSLTSLLLPLPGGSVSRPGQYVLSLTVSPVSGNRPRVVLEDQFIVVPQGFISVNPVPRVVTRPLDPSGPIPISVELSTTSSSIVGLANLMATVVLQTPNAKQGERSVVLQSVNNFSSLPRACVLVSEPGRYSFDLTQPNWEMRYVSSSLPLPLRECVKSAMTLDAYGKIVGTYHGFKWYRIWKIGTLEFAPPI